MRAGLTLLLFLAGCSCGEDPELVVEGENGYVRCHAAPEPAPREWSVGPARIVREGRALRVTGLPDPARLVAFSGPVDAAGWERVRALRPDVIAIVGGIPDRIPELAAPVLLLAGGMDEHPGYAAVAEDRDGVIDVTPYRSVHLGAVELVVVGGSPGGRYVAGPRGCGLGADEADAWELPAAEGPRVLLSWAGPTGVPGIEGAEAGSALLAAIGEAAAVDLTVYAWPSTEAGSATDARIALRPAAGPWVERADGSRAAPRATVIHLSERGVRVASAAP